MSTSLESVAVLFVFIALGWIGRRTLLSAEMLPGLNRFVYYFAVPALLFDAASKLSLEQLLEPLPLTAFFLGVLITGGLTLVGSYSLFHCRSGSQLTARVLNTTFANYAYMGIPVVSALLGEGGYLPTITIILAGNLFLIGGTQMLLQAFESRAEESHSIGQQIWQILSQSLLKSPVFLSTVLGLSWSATDFSIPLVLDQALMAIGGVTVPLALFCLGAGLQLRMPGAALFEIIWLILVKLFVHPGVTLLILVGLGVTGVNWIVALVMLTALPTGALAHVVTAHYRVYEQETSVMVTTTTVLSVLTLPVWISVISRFM